MDDSSIRRSMQANVRKDTKPEVVVRRLLRNIGYPGRKLAIFVNGCFWHHHDGCSRATVPRSNTDFWKTKFSRNRARDADTVAGLEADGWRVMTVWECELKDLDRVALESRLRGFIEGGDS